MMIEMRDYKRNLISIKIDNVKFKESTEYALLFRYNNRYNVIYLISL
jgi:hypothetical protein